MKTTYTRREVLSQAAMALPALHFGFGSPAIVRALTRDRRQTPRFQRLELATRADRLTDMRKFYKDVMNFPLVAEDANSLTMQTGRTRVKFYAAPGGGSPFYHFAFNIPENKLEESVDWLSGRARLLKGRTGNHVVHFKWLDAHSVYFYDPAGNLLEFIAHHPLNNPRPGKFNVEDILYTSEIGLVTGDVPRLGSELDAKLGLTNYAAVHHQPVSDVFRPIGDPYGFFIVVKHKRTWLMTNDPAGLYPVTAEMRGEEHGKLTLQNCACDISVTKSRV